MPTRRELLALAPAALLSRLASSTEPPPRAAAPADVNATEDLMREHGVLRRVLIVYEEGGRRLAKGDESVAGVLAGAATLVERFVEAYPEILEEQLVFPRFEKHPTLGPLCATLRTQHAVGRRLTQVILAEARRPAKERPDRAPLVRALGDFSHMYAAHAAREDTDLFPAFHALFTEKEFDALGDQFEAEEARLLGKEGFEGAVKHVAELEEKLGLGELAGFTPR